MYAGYEGSTGVRALSGLMTRVELMLASGLKTSVEQPVHAMRLANGDGAKCLQWRLSQCWHSP